MLESCIGLYKKYYAGKMELYKKRIETLKKEADIELLRYIRNELPLFTTGPGNTTHYVKMETIESDMKNACAKGLSFVEYKIHKHYYPGYKGDNISFFTCKYYIYEDAFIEIPGAPSYLDTLRQKLPGFLITFRECEHNNGFLRVELPS